MSEGKTLWLARDGSGHTFLYESRPEWSEPHERWYGAKPVTPLDRGECLPVTLTAGGDTVNRRKPCGCDPDMDGDCKIFCPCTAGCHDPTTDTVEVLDLVWAATYGTYFAERRQRLFLPTQDDFKSIAADAARCADAAVAHTPRPPAPAEVQATVEIVETCGARDLYGDTRKRCARTLGHSGDHLDQATDTPPPVTTEGESE